MFCGKGIKVDVQLITDKYKRVISQISGQVSVKYKTYQLIFGDIYVVGQNIVYSLLYFLKNEPFTRRKSGYFAYSNFS